MDILSLKKESVTPWKRNTPRTIILDYNVLYDLKGGSKEISQNPDN